MAAHSFNRRAFYLLLFVLLDVVEAKGDDLDDDLKEDFHPVVILL